MSELVSATVICKDPGDGSGDIIIDLPPSVLESMNLDIGDLLTIELVEGAIVLKPVRNADKKS
ncbi:MAG: AbrB/MazE/SpoVT family DNA-binding domain-containing protein [Pseudomonas sp.]|uniref:AbrB/MazE/SpoVT family DNA-binding domain-containing protein n=1 Tax=Pseudomonas sp. TaxID=306 RepID=UPI002FCB3CE9